MDIRALKVLLILLVTVAHGRVYKYSEVENSDAGGLALQSLTSDHEMDVDTEIAPTSSDANDEKDLTSIHEDAPLDEYDWLASERLHMRRKRWCPWKVMTVCNMCMEEQRKYL